MSSSIATVVLCFIAVAFIANQSSAQLLYEPAAVVPTLPYYSPYYYSYYGGYVPAAYEYVIGSNRGAPQQQQQQPNQPHPQQQQQQMPSSPAVRQ